MDFIWQTLLLAYTMSHKQRIAVPNPNAMSFTAATRTFGKLINSSTNSLFKKKKKKERFIMDYTPDQTASMKNKW